MMNKEQNDEVSDPDKIGTGATVDAMKNKCWQKTTY